MDHRKENIRLGQWLCTLCSVTSFTLRDGQVTAVDYAEPVADLLPAVRNRRFKVGT